MKVLINCSNLRFGGGKTVAINIIRQLLKHDLYYIILIVPEDPDYAEFDKNKDIIKYYVPKVFNKVYFKPLLNSRYLKNIVYKLEPDLILSLGNIAIPTKIRQILLIHQPYFAYRDSIVWQKLDFRFYVFIKMMVYQISRNLKFADQVLVQTNAMRKRIVQNYSLPIDQVKLFPNAVNLTNMQTIKELDPIFSKGSIINLLFLSKYYPHKNFEILISLAIQIKKLILNIRISVTLDANESSETAKFLQKIKANQLENIIVNIGNVPFDEIPKVYESHHGLFMPTLLESFSGTYIEAMFYGRPIFTSHIDFATEVCKDAAYYFDPLSINDILDTINNAFLDINLMMQKVEKGKKYSSQFKNWDQLGQDLVNYIGS